MSDDLVKQSIAELLDIVRCRCHPAYKDRGMQDPDCECDSADAVKVVADRIEELKAKLAKHDALMQAGFAEYERRLAKAVEALGNVVGEYDLFRKDEYERGLSPLDDEIHDARTTLAELKGEDRG